jgi:uncharacterized protein involved in exopolysaccharide biosynthesis
VARSEGEMDLNELNSQRQVILLWRARRFVFGITLACTLVATTAAFLVSKQYDGAVQLSPVSPDKGGSFGSSTSELGALGALAGVSLGNDSAKNEAIAVLQSENLTDAYIEKNKLLPVLYSKDWDPTANSWKSPKAASEHTLWKANRYFDRSIRKVTSNNKTGILTMTITWRDPVEAARWANGLVAMANDFLRDKAIQQSERNIAYLTEEAVKTNIVEARQVIFTIMQKELTKAMVARGSEEYAFKVIDPATVSEIPSFPKKTVWILGGGFGGLLLSISLVAIRSNLSI